MPETKLPEMKQGAVPKHRPLPTCVFTLLRGLRRRSSNRSEDQLKSIFISQFVAVNWMPFVE